MLLLLSALIIAGVAAQLLSRERTRLGDAAREAERGRLGNSAEQISLAVTVVQDELMRALRDIPADQLPDTLREWERTKPLVRNVFIWRGAGDLLLPDASLPLTREEQGFLKRYKTLFDGVRSWKEENDGNEQYSSLSQKLLWRAQSAAPKIKGGWIPWYWEDRLGMIVWVQQDEVRYGVELEMIALLAELVPAMPSDLVGQRAVVLRDGSGRRILQTGSLAIEESASPVLTVPVGPVLPHWELVLYTVDGELDPAAGGYFILSGLLVAILFVALFSAGALLLREAHRNRTDALQKTTFVSNVSHELKTPLTTIRMYAELLKEGRLKDPEKQRRYLGTIASESERLTRLVNNVLDFGRLEQNRKQYRISTFDLCEAVSEAVQSQRIRIAEAGMELQVDLPGDPAQLESDRDAVQQALLNLIDNAVKYAASGKMLHIKLTAEAGQYRIAVADAGQGIGEAHRRKIFDRFYRIDDSITACSQGSGLGLGLSRRLLTDLGGSLEYRPAEGGGACFVMTIPRRNSR